MVRITSAPENAEVYMDGVFVGNAPATLRLSPGNHVFRFTLAGYQERTLYLQVFANSESSLVANLDKR